MPSVKQEHIVRQISAPSIKIDELAFEDFESGEMNSTDTTNRQNNLAKGYPIKYSKMQGASHPLMKINEFVFQQGDTAYMKIDTSGFLPTITTRLLIKSKSMYTSDFPKDGDILSVFIRSKDLMYMSYSCSSVIYFFGLTCLSTSEDVILTISSVIYSSWLPSASKA